LCDETQNIFKMTAIKSKGTKKVNKWKEKAKARSSELKLVKMELVRVKKSRVKWRSKYKGIQATVRGNKVANHCYSLEIMTLGVLLHITYNISLRATAKALASFSAMYNQKIKIPSATTIRNWSLQLGLYYLTKTIASGRYVLVADESISISHREHYQLNQWHNEAREFEITYLTEILRVKHPDCHRRKYPNRKSHLLYFGLAKSTNCQTDKRTNDKRSDGTQAIPKNQNSNGQKS
jgi:hypothetical protein